MKENIHLTHIKLKPTKRIEIGFDPKELGKNIKAPEESVKLAKKIQNSKQYSDDYDIILMFEDHVIYAFDYLHKGQKILIPEINPITIFYSNALMSHRKLLEFREKLFRNSPTIKNYSKNPINPSLFSDFFQLASNCIFNLQSTLESFVNIIITDNQVFKDKNGNDFEPSIFHKLDKALPNIKDKRFKSKFKKENKQIRELIELRNEIIHLKPIDKSTNTQYKITYRRLLKFDYRKTIFAVREFIDFYEPNLIEECECEKEFYYDIKTAEKCKHY